MLKLEETEKWEILCFSNDKTNAGSHQFWPGNVMWRASWNSVNTDLANGFLFVQCQAMV